jgi:hypothetical protein
MLNSESVANWQRYVAAPAEAFQDSVNVVAWFVEPLAGDARMGADGAGGIVVKLHVLEYALVPPLFFAVTCQ